MTFAQITAAKVVSGSARGRRIGTPTINIDPAQAPKELRHGIYACRISIAGKRYMGAMHYGLRPVFKDTETLEVHVLDATIERAPETVNIEIVGKIRNVKDFPGPEQLKEAIGQDIEAVRAMLRSHEEISPKHHP